MTYDIITIGSATQDVFLSADEMRVRERELCLPFGAKIQAQKVVFASGGGGTNAAVTFARQGFSTAAIGVIGQDANGAAILDELRKEGIDAKYFQLHHDDMTAYSVVLVGQGGERTILSYKGEGMHWDVKQIPWHQLKAKWMYVNSLGGHEDVLKEIVLWARENNAHLVTNPGGTELRLGLDRLVPYWKHFDVVGMSQEEAAQITGLSYDQEEAIFKKMDAAIGGIFIMTKGGQGCAVSDGHHMYSAGIPDSLVAERTGAGDAFHSGFTAEFIRTGNIEKAMQFATANASSVVAHFGAKAGILKKGEQGSWPLVKVEKKPL